MRIKVKLVQQTFLNKWIKILAIMYLDSHALLQVSIIVMILKSSNSLQYCAQRARNLILKSVAVACHGNRCLYSGINIASDRYFGCRLQW